MSPAEPPINVLVVDDSDVDQVGYRRYLASADGAFVINSAETGEEGLEMIARLAAHCIVLGFHLPDMDGLEFLSKMPRGKDGKPVAVIMVTGQGNEYVAVEAMKCGVHDYLVKSEINARQLEHIIHGAVEKAGLECDLMESKKQLERLAFYDPLTDLANRNLFHNRLNHTLQLAERNKGSVCLMLIDLDGFKNINDTLGHQAGDFVLRQVGQNLAAAVRRSDTVARIGGDECGVILETGATFEGILLAAAKLVSAGRSPFFYNGETLSVGLSIGIAT